MAEDNVEKKIIEADFPRIPKDYRIEKHDHPSRRSPSNLTEPAVIIPFPQDPNRKS